MNLDVVEEWLEEYENLVSDDCYYWYETHPEYRILHELEPDNRDWKAPLDGLNPDEVREALEEGIGEPGDVYADAPDAADLADPECEDCEGTGVFEGECHCVTNNDVDSVAICLIRAVRYE